MLEKKGLYVSVRADKSLKIQLALSIRGRGRPRGNNVRKYPPTEHVNNATLTFLVVDTSACKPETDLLFVRTIFSVVFAHISFLNKQPQTFLNSGEPFLAVVLEYPVSCR